MKVVITRYPGDAAQVSCGVVGEAGYSVSSRLPWAEALRYAVDKAGPGATVEVVVRGERRSANSKRMVPGVVNRYRVQLPRVREAGS